MKTNDGVELLIEGTNLDEDAINDYFRMSPGRYWNTVNP